LSENLLKYPEAAARLGISLGTLQNWVFQKKFPHIKIGRLVRFSPQDITDYINAHRVEVQEK
jgi:excisionase family DNA binding protein